MSRRTRAAAGLGVVAACAAAGLVSRLLGGADGQSAPYRPVLAPPPKLPLNCLPAPRALAGGAPSGDLDERAAIGDGTDAPKRSARPVARLSRRTPEGSANIVLVIGHAGDARGRVWVRARLPGLPNRTTGWVPRSALGA
jgi:hypothetical protein